MLTVKTRASVVVLALLLAGPTSAVAQSSLTPTLSVAVSGNTVTFNWTAVPGALGYLAEFAAAGGAVIPLPVPNQTSAVVPGVPPGTYYARIRGVAGSLQGPPSNIVTIVVPPAPPAAPSGLSALINGLDMLLSWTAPPDGARVWLQAGLSPGGGEIGTIPLAPNATSFALNGVPAGNYYVRLFGEKGGAFSGPSNELLLALPGCTAPGPIPLKMTAFAGFVSISWPAVPGAVGYQLNVASTPNGGADVLSQAFGPGTTHVQAFGVGTGKYYLTLHTQLGCGAPGTSGVQMLDVSANSGTGPRTPDPAPGQRLPLPPYTLAVIQATAAQYPGDLRNSCGNTTWLFRLVQNLRKFDSRWGLNLKRGYQGLSQDVVDYHFGPGPEEGSTDVYILDTISGHCGGNPRGWLNDVTDETAEGGSIGRWTLLPFLQAGFTP